MMKWSKTTVYKNVSGISLIEVVISLSIIVTVLVGLVAAFQFFISASVTNTEKIQSAYLVEEGFEVIRFFRDQSWSNISDLTTDTDYYLHFSGGTWSTTTTATTTNSFTRRIKVHDVYRRDSDSVIVASTSPDTKTLDVNTKFVTAKVTTPLGNDVEASIYVTNLFDN